MDIVKSSILALHTLGDTLAVKNIIESKPSYIITNIVQTLSHCRLKHP